MLHELSRHLSISSQRNPPPPALTDWIESHRPFPARAAYIEERYVVEPYRLVLSLLSAYLAEASREDMKSRLLESGPHQAHIYLKDLLEPIDIIAHALPKALLYGEFFTAQNKLGIFGLHSVRLDIRENSSNLNQALGEILRALEITPDFEDLSATERITLLTRLLQEPADYAALKEDLAWRLFKGLDKRVPGLSKHIVFWDLGTPLTNVHYLNATRGNLYGISKSPKQVGPWAFPIKSEIEGLYMVGASTTSHGVAGVTQSGIECAKQILGVRTREILNRNGPEIEIYPSEDISKWPVHLQKKISRDMTEDGRP